MIEYVTTEAHAMTRPNGSPKERNSSTLEKGMNPMYPTPLGLGLWGAKVNASPGMEKPLAGTGLPHSGQLVLEVWARRS
jgi:hypothetical protein